MGALTLARRAIIRAGLYSALRPYLGWASPVRRRDRRDAARLVELLSATLSYDADCIDVGAHTGAILSIMMRAAPAGRFIAYEPIPDLAKALRRQYPHVDVRQAALAEEAGVAQFNYVVDMPSNSGLDPKEYAMGKPTIARFEVHLETLDEMLPSDFWPEFIKIDVEGSEIRVLRGALATLRTYRPLVVFEHDGHGLSSSADVYRLLTGLGMMIFDLDGRPYDLASFKVTALSGERWNWVAR